VRESRVLPKDLDRVHVVFGREDWSNLELDSLGPEDGFLIEGTVGPCLGFGPFPSCLQARSVDAAGDVNGDGLDDVIVGSPAPGLTIGIGSAYVVFGKASGAPVDVRSLGSAGFRIRGIRTEDQTGQFVSGAGDVNGDGLADVALTGPDRRSVYVVFGKASTGTVELGTIGAAGFRIDPGDDVHDIVGQVAGLGDTNGDGLSDLIVGLPVAGREGNGRAFVVFGKRDAGAVDATALGAGGYRIGNSSSHSSAGTGQSVAAAGDVNGDARADLLIGAPGADNNVGGSGSVYVLFGQATAIDLDLASFTNGFRIDGKDVGHGAGWSVSGDRDVNRDGRPDIVVGAAFGDFDGRTQAGSAYIVFGKSSPATVRLGGLNPGQVEIGGAHDYDLTGASVGLGDFDGDGRADALIGAPQTDGTNTDSGSAYVVLAPVLPRELSLSPETATNTIGDQHCVTAHAEDAAGAPAPGFSVRFDVTGVNATSATEQTDSGGDAVFCYEGGLTPGTDQIAANADGNGNGSRDPGEPGAVAAKEWVVPGNGPDCAVSFNGQIVTQAGGRATLNGRAETTGGAASGRQAYMDRALRLRVRSTTVDALVCAEDGSAASLFGKANGNRIYRIDLGRDDLRTGTYRIRLDSGYDSGQRRVRGRVRIRL
jgi:hypothetical protein